MGETNTERWWVGQTNIGLEGEVVGGSNQHRAGGRGGGWVKPT